MEEKLGFHQEPEDANGVVFAKTSGRLCKWEIPRGQRALEKVRGEWQGIDSPGVYILFQGKKVYIGEAKDLYGRLRTHFQTPEDKIGDWDKVVILNDGRTAALSDFNDSVIRKCFERYLILLFKANKYVVVSQASQSEDQMLNPQQRSIADALTPEFNFILLKNNLIDRLIEEPGQEEVLLDDLEKIILKKGWTVSELSAYEATVNAEKAYIRPGSKKEKGWQITFRDRFKDSLEKGKGYLLVNRGPVLYIPFKEIQRVIQDPSSYKQNTIDIYINFKAEKIELSYKAETINISGFRIKS